MFFVIGLVPYVIMSLVMVSIGYNYTTWQYWVIVACSILSDLITAIKTKFNL